MRLDDLRKEMPETPDFIHKMIQEEVEPVSYTHLDVYKRQDLREQKV